MEGVATSGEERVEASLRGAAAAWRREAGRGLAPERAAFRWALAALLLVARQAAGSTRRAARSGTARRLGIAALVLGVLAAAPAVLGFGTPGAPPQSAAERPAREAPARPAEPISVAWLASVGPYRVERMRAARTGLRVDLSRPAAGVGHTTECSFECAVRVFRRRHAPNFLVGRDRLGKVRIVQFVPLGEAAATMRNLRGGVQTNRWARVQVELVARSQRRPWSPDPQVLAAFAHLVAELRDVAGIPLARPFSRSVLAAERRGSGTWGRAAGWFSHAEVPENDHWDMGAFQWRRLFAAAELASRRSLAGTSE